MDFYINLFELIEKEKNLRLEMKKEDITQKNKCMIFF